jgi:peptidoglycan/xylan/chitin deacetylase (PgdA/CDA1 family)
MLGFSISMYHSVAENSRDPHAVHPEIFAQQMESLQQQGYRVVGLGAALAGLREWKLEYRTVALTFDDSYEDFLAHAVPILRQHCFDATVFAPTGLLGGSAQWDSYDKTKRLMDWDEMREVERPGFQVARSWFCPSSRARSPAGSVKSRCLKLLCDT